MRLVDWLRAALAETWNLNGPESHGGEVMD